MADTIQKKDGTFSARVNKKRRDKLIKRYGGLQAFLDFCIKLDDNGLLKPIERILNVVKRQNRKTTFENLKKTLLNKEALESYQDYEEPDDSLDKHLK